ncbi:hypothetical protein GCM10023321_77390 [Pseudonocardia eucalypti]|uniref:Aminoglycoside phosphotransferase domain-containing protein n=1 Tax=Pseudonocardia eucalypti TaxID=648755 RepID=A0ABP9RBY4_9PSEU|nr:hypothetical protein [Pseudonocardia eucalypti]
MNDANDVVVYGTGLLRTQIWTEHSDSRVPRTGGTLGERGPRSDSRARLTGRALGERVPRYVWRRTTGPLAPAPFAVPTEELTRALHEGGARVGGPVGTAVAEPDPVARLYRAPGPVSVAAVLLSDQVPERARPAELMRGLGECLRMLHALPADGAEPAVSPSGAELGARPVAPAAPAVAPTRGLSRLGDWLDGRAPTATGRRGSARLRQALGGERWAALGAWQRSVAADPGRCPVHGAPGLGSLAADAGLTRAVLLCGEDVGHAPWYTDVGWVVGELTELASCRPAALPWSELVAALRDGYGREFGVEVNRMAALRIALHLHDFLCYVRWSDAECARYAGMLRAVMHACEAAA